MISVLVNFQRAFAAAPSVLLGWCGTSIYLRIPPRRRRTDTLAQFLSIHLPPRAPSHPRLGFTGGVHLCIYLCHDRSPSHGRRFVYDCFFLHIYLASPKRRRTGLSVHLCGHLPYVTKHMRFPLACGGASDWLVKGLLMGL